MVAIDGPSGSGKSSVSRAIAREFGLAYLDTGAMYRALAWWSLHGHTDMSTCPLEVSTDPDRAFVAVDGQDISNAIRGPEVTSAVSRVAADPAVREIAVAMQRRFIADAPHGIVVEGRDITSVVAPDADVRLFLTADLEARETRRAREFADEETSARMRATVAARDAIDSTRAHSPLRLVDGVTTIDATHLTLDEVVATVRQLVIQSLGGSHD